MHRVVWIVGIICRAKDKRNRHSQSAGRFGEKCSNHPLEGLCEIGDAGFTYRNTPGLACSKQLAAKLSIPHRYELEDLCPGRHPGHFCCTGDCQFPGTQVSDGKPGNKPTLGVTLCVRRCDRCESSRMS